MLGALAKSQGVWRTGADENVSEKQDLPQKMSYLHAIGVTGANNLTETTSRKRDCFSSQCQGLICDCLAPCSHVEWQVWCAFSMRTSFILQSTGTRGGRAGDFR